MKERQIIAIIGRICSGKDTAARFLESRYGFKKIVMSNFLRAEARKRKIHPTREHLRKLQAELRRENGNYYLVDLAIKKIKESKKNAVIDGLRDYKEALYAWEKLNLKIILIEADQLLRFKRMKARARKGDAKTYPEFLHQDALEDATFDFPKTMKLADFIVDSEKGKEEMFKGLRDVLKKVKG